MISPFNPNEVEASTYTSKGAGPPEVEIENPAIGPSGRLAITAPGTLNIFTSLTFGP